MSADEVLLLATDLTGRVVGVGCVANDELELETAMVGNDGKSSASPKCDL